MASTPEHARSPSWILPWTGLALVAAAWRLSSGRAFYFPLDDAYITLHNAQAVWQGHDWTYGVSALTGATSLIHLAVLTVLLPITGAVSGGIVACLLATAGYCLGVERLAARYSLGLPATTALMIVALGSGFTLYHLCNGLETGLVLASTTWALVLASAKRPSRALAVLCGLLPFIHPELAALSGALLARQGYVRLRQAPSGAAVVAIVQDAALVALAATPWLLWSWSQTGQILPNTAGAKIAYFADAQAPLAVKLDLVLTALVFGVGVPVLALPLVRPSSMAAASWLFLLAFLAVFFATFPDGLCQNYCRYTAALLPVCLWALCEIQSRKPVGPALLIAATVLTLPCLVLAYGALTESPRIIADEAAAADWTRAHVRGDEPVLVHDAGLIAFSSPLRLVDLVGLKTPSSIAFHRKWTLPSGGKDRARAIDEIARLGRVRYAVIHHGPAFWSDIAGDLRSRGWRLTRVRESAIPAGYDVFALTAP